MRDCSVLYLTRTWVRVREVYGEQADYHLDSSVSPSLSNDSAQCQPTSEHSLLHLAVIVDEKKSCCNGLLRHSC